MHIWKYACIPFCDWAVIDSEIFMRKVWRDVLDKFASKCHFIHKFLWMKNFSSILYIHFEELAFFQYLICISSMKYPLMKLLDQIISVTYKAKEWLSINKSSFFIVFNWCKMWASLAYKAFCHGTLHIIDMCTYDCIRSYWAFGAKQIG